MTLIPHFHVSEKEFTTLKDLPTLPMNYKSSEIEQILFDKQIQTYTRIMDLINRDFDNMDEERLSILLRNCIDMFGDIQLHIKNIKSREMYQ